MKTLYLHIGTPKTGTTSIQHFCYDNMDRLSEEGYYYPELPFKYENKGKYRNGLFLEAIYYNEEGNREIEKEKENFNLGLKAIEEYFNTYDNIILSDEGIWTACFNRKRGKNLMEELQQNAQSAGYQIKIIVYLRRQDDFLVSWYNQLIKHNISNKNTISWDEYFQNYSQYVQLDYLRCLKKLKNIFGMENIIVRRFDRQYFKGGSLIADFLDIFGIELNDCFYVDNDYKKFNTKMSENACEIKRIINSTTEMNIDEIRKFEWILREFSPISEEKYPCSMMSEDESYELMQLYELSNRKIAKRYINDGKPLFSDSKKHKEKWKKNNIHMIDDIIRFSCMSTLYTIRMIEKRDEEIKDLRRIIEHPFRSIFHKIITN